MHSHAYISHKTTPLFPPPRLQTAITESLGYSSLYHFRHTVIQSLFFCDPESPPTHLHFSPVPWQKWPCSGATGPPGPPVLRPASMPRIWLARENDSGIATVPHRLWGVTERLCRKRSVTHLSAQVSSRRDTGMARPKFMFAIPRFTHLNTRDSAQISLVKPLSGYGVLYGRSLTYELQISLAKPDGC